MPQEPVEPDDRHDPPSRRRWSIIGAGAVVVAAVAIALALFQPWQLWVDDTVDEAAPVGAVAITTPADAPPASMSAPGPPTTSASSTAPAATAPPTVPATMPATTVPATTAPAAMPATTAPATTAPATTAPATTVAPMPIGGEFISIDHGTTGSVVLLQDPSGTRFVRLENLDTTNGPDLFVYLSTNPADGEEGRFDDDVVNLGRLQGNVGSSNYVVPEGTDLSRYASVVIWCDRFNSGFGAAPLNG